MQRREFLGLCGAATVLALSGRPAWPYSEVTPSGPFNFAIEPPGPDFSWDSAAFAWEFSQLAYGSKEQIRAGAIPSQGIPADQLTDFPGPPGLALHDTQALAWLRDDYSIIAYRGTEAAQALAGIQQGEYGKEVLDVLTDLRYYQRKLGESHGNARVHSGFFEAVEETWPFVEAILDLGKPAIFVGHSLGGALATYAAYKAQKAQKAVRAVWTFGSPRVGNPDFARAYNDALGLVTYRFANELDVVARLPVRGFSHIPFLPAYRHVGKPIVLWSDGNVSADWAQMMRTIRIDDQMVSTFFEDVSFAPHLLYEPAVFAKNAPTFLPSFEAEGAPKGLALRLIVDLASLQDLTSQSKIDAFRARWRLD